MIAEPTAATYSDEDLTGYIEAYPIRDGDEEAPYLWDGDSWEDNPDWDPTYDLNAAAAEIWLEKAAGLAGEYDAEVNEGGVSLYQKKSDRYEHAMKMHRRYQSKRVIESFAIRAVDDPDTSYVINLIG